MLFLPGSRGRRCVLLLRDEHAARAKRPECCGQRDEPVLAAAGALERLSSVRKQLLENVRRACCAELGVLESLSKHRCDGYNKNPAGSRASSFYSD